MSVRPHRVGHPLAVGRALGIRDGPDLREVVEGERTALRGRGGRRDEQDSQNGCNGTVSFAWTILDGLQDADTGLRKATDYRRQRADEQH